MGNYMDKPPNKALQPTLKNSAAEFKRYTPNTKNEIMPSNENIEM